MAENEPKAAETDIVPRAPRSIRFSNSEWATVEQASRERGMTAAELARHVAMSRAEGRLATDPVTSASSIAARIERIYRGVYLLPTLKRDEMVQQGREDEHDQIMEGARESQASIRDISPKV